MALVPPTFLQPLLTRPVAIFGGGPAGRGVQEVLAALGVEGRIYDATASGGTPFTAGAARSHALVVFSPEFSLGHPWTALARAAGAECLGEIDFASQFWAGRIVAVTGSANKTTLAEFVTHTLVAIGRIAHAAGHADRPFSRLVAEEQGGAYDTIAVCAVDAVQAETLRVSRPDALLWVNFAENHPPRYPSPAAYFGAKWNLVSRTDGEAVFVGSSVQRHARKYGLPLPPFSAVATEDQPPLPALAHTIFAGYPERELFLLTRAWWRAGGLLDEQLIEAAREFRADDRETVAVQPNWQ